MIFACPGSGAGDSNNYMFSDGSIIQTNVWGDSVHNSSYSQSSNDGKDTANGDGVGYGSTNNGYGDGGGASNGISTGNGNGDGSGDGMARFP